MIHFKTNKNGFTLLELLIVIALVAALTLTGFTNYFSSLKKGRDAKRKQDLKFIQQAMEQYYSVCKFSYPALASSQGDDLPTSVSGTTPTCDTNYSFTFPKDPSGQPYVCERSGGCNNGGYTICPSAQKIASRLEAADCSDTSCCITNIQ